MKKSIKFFLTLAILSGFAFNSVPKKNSYDHISNNNMVEIAKFCNGSGAKCFSLFWGLITVYKGKDNAMFE